MKKYIGNFLLKGWTPTPLEQALMDGNIDQYLAEATDLDDGEISTDFLEVQDFDTAMEEIKAELDDDINASEIFAKRFGHLSPEKVRAMYKEYFLIPFPVVYDPPTFVFALRNRASMLLSAYELSEVLVYRYHLSDEQVIVPEMDMLDRVPVHVLIADNSEDFQAKDNLSVIKEDVALFGYTVSDVRDEMTFHNVPFMHIILEPQYKQ